LFAAHALPADVAFSSDNQRIYAVSENENDTEPELREINLSTKTARVIRLVELAPRESVLDLASGDGGNILFITPNNLWSFDPRSRRATKLCSAPSGKPFSGVSYDPKSHVPYVTVQAENDRLYRVKNGHELVPVRVRRHDQISCLVFSSEGKLFYEESGELWCGEITSDTGDEVEEKEIFSVTAERYAPLAYLETHRYMSSEMYVENLAVARDGIYVHPLHPRSLGGGLWGVLLKLPPPIREAETERDSSVGESTVKRLGQTGQVLQGVKSLGDTEKVGPGYIEVSLGASPDGSRVYYKKHDVEYLVTNGKAEELHLRTSDEMVAPAEAATPTGKLLSVASTKHSLEEKDLKSETGDVKARITFVNRSKQPVKVYWLDYRGQRVLYKKLKPSESYTQDTYMTHPWLITDLYDNAWEVYMPSVQPRTVIITAPKKR
jgi:hypothetical protein